MKKNSKKNNVNLGVTLIMMGIGGLCGAVMTLVLGDVFEGLGFVLGLALELLILIIAYFIQIVLHEAGHLVAGLMSGYGFGSFRIGGIMIHKENGRLKISKHAVAGTGGQCIMKMPPMTDGRYPVIFYNLGGVLMNLVTVPICVLLAVVSKNLSVLYVFFVMMALTGLITALTNGIPLKMGMLNNDGSNVKELYNNPEAMRSLWCQFKVVEELGEGRKLSDMPDEWFFMPSAEGMNNSIAASAAVFLENRLMADGKFKEAAELCDKLLAMDSALIGLHKNLLLTDRITVGLLLSENASQMAALYESTEYQLFAKQMKTNISVIRASYAYARLVKSDDKLSAEALANFNKCAPTHPYSVEVESERALIKMIDEFAANK